MAPFAYTLSRTYRRLTPLPCSWLTVGGRTARIRARMAYVDLRRHGVTEAHARRTVIDLLMSGQSAMSYEPLPHGAATVGTNEPAVRFQREVVHA